MIPKECKRLAEVDFPIAVVSRHSAREKSIRHGHPSTLHLWWARHPLVETVSARSRRYPISYDTLKSWAETLRDAMCQYLVIKNKSCWPGGYPAELACASKSESDAIAKRRRRDAQRGNSALRR